MDSFSGHQAGDAKEIAGQKLGWCPPGTFLMGSPAGEKNHRPDEAQVQVKLSRGFWMGAFEVSQKQWIEVMGQFPQGQPKPDGPNYPVVWVNYSDCEAFCTKLTQKAHADGSLPPTWSFRLPTEAQWEYACRAGTTNASAFGDALSSVHANFNWEHPYFNGPGSSSGQAPTAPFLNRPLEVQAFKPNAWGLYQMHGNVFEWCRDWYVEKLPGGTDPLVTRKGKPNRDGSFSRSRRGGSWGDKGQFCRSALRMRYEPERAADHIGFRVVLEFTPIAPP